MSSFIQDPKNVMQAYARIKPYIHNTPIIKSNILNQILGNNIFFKMDVFQKTGAFKIRGVLNHLLALKERGAMPQKIVSYSTGNHALAMAYAANLFGITARIYLPINVAPIKKEIAESYGAELLMVNTRKQAEESALHDAQNQYHYLHPSDNDDVIAGAGTICYEALIEMESKHKAPDAIFASCGGGGLLSGSYLAKQLRSPCSTLHAAEPEIANDAYLSVNQDKIFKFDHSPKTIADGLRSLSVSARTLDYLKKIDQFHLISEESIHHWTIYIMQMLKITCETSSAISMAAADSWIKCTGYKDKTILILMTGGNIDPAFFRSPFKM